MILKIVNGKLELRKDNGSLEKVIVERGVVDADLNPENTLIVITLDNGRVDLRKTNGSLYNTVVPSKATRARFNGKDIAITLDSGKIDLRKENGTLIRSL